MTRIPAQPLSLNVVAAGAALCLAACGGGSSGYRADASTAEQPMSATSATAGSALYDEPYRPQLQFTPARNWMNDPNGLVWFDGEYHLFYQYNPNGTTWGDMSWGHAVSKDLVHWEELPVALPVEKDAQGRVTQMFFSGSAVVDKNNTSGFGRPGQPAMVAIFTSLYPQRTTLANGRTVEAGTQAQSIAYSTDRGRTWTQYAGNPVIPLPPAPYQDEFREFRDPKVFWYEPEQKWVMVAVLSQQRKAVLYSSKNLKDWTFMSEFGPANAVGGVLECPDLFELPVDGDRKKSKWVLVINLNPGSVAGGSGAQYFTGSFDGKTFVSDSIIDKTPPTGSTFADFEAASYAAAGWAATGDFAGAATAPGNLPGQGGVADFVGSRLANTFVNGDGGTGTLSSPKFRIDAKYINLMVGGGRHPHEADAGDGTVPPGLPLFPGADFEGPDDVTYAQLGWTPSGDLVGQKVSTGAILDQQPVSGFEGRRLANTFFGGLLGVGGDTPKGNLTSPTFTISKPYINFLIGGGSHAYASGEGTAVVLVVDGQVVRTATGQDNEALNWTHWDVQEFIGKPAQVVIVDQNAGGWGHINADQFMASDQPARPVSHETTVNLLVDGKVVLSETGENSESLTWRNWSVAAWAGREAQIQIVDKNTGGWGHILVDQITFSNQRKETANWVDWGADFYAAVSWNNVPGGRRVWTGWMSNWDYAGSTPTSPWRSAQTFARELGLVTIDGKTRLVQKPVNELKSLRLEPALDTAKLAVPPGVTPLKVVNPGGQPAEIRADFVPGNASSFGLKVLTGSNGEETVVGYDALAGEVYIDRTKSGNASFSSTFAARHAAPLPVRNGLVKLRVIVDRSSVTVFAGDHEVVLTDQVFPDPSSQGMAVFAAGGHAELRKLTVWPLKSIWARQ
jgi:sucrose-6-phosphate hydrolase SacC (GH32 family)